MQKTREKHKKLEMILKLTPFSMSNLMAPYFQPFLTPLFNIGHDLGNMIKFEKKITFITHNKK